MDLKRFVIGESVEPMQMLDARESRVQRQREIQRRFPMPLVSFTLNIPGSIKVFPLSVETFTEGMELIRCHCKARGIPIRNVEETRGATGWEGFLSVDAPAKKVKAALVLIEESCTLGRLMDIDVLDSGGEMLSRTELGYPARTCPLCGSPAFVCSRSRVHPVEKLLEFECAVMEDYFAQRYAEGAASAAARALLYEVLTTPKPGLIDKRNNGAHDDMDLTTFENSALVLIPYFKEFIAHGIKHWNTPPERLLDGLREIGVKAEISMLRTTGGVNTHKGIIFSMGILSAAMGMCWGKGELPSRQQLRWLSQAIVAPIESDFQGLTVENAVSHGERLYVQYGLKGARGEAMAGFPTLFETALPRLDQLLLEGWDLNDAGVAVLLEILSVSEDSNVAARSSWKRMLELSMQARDILEEGNDRARLLAAAKKLDDALIAEKISPGGSADLLALSYYVHFLEREGFMTPSS